MVALRTNTKGTSCDPFMTFQNDHLQAMSAQSLYARAKQAGIVGRSTMTRDQLIDAIHAVEQMQSSNRGLVDR